jgi:hypothetical protein
MDPGTRSPLVDFFRGDPWWGPIEFALGNIALFVPLGLFVQLRFKTFRYHTHRLFEQSLEGGTTESGDTKFRKYFLLANSQIEPTRADVCGGRTVWRRFDNRRLRAAAQRVARCWHVGYLLGFGQQLRK